MFLAPPRSRGGEAVLRCQELPLWEIVDFCDAARAPSVILQRNHRHPQTWRAKVRHDTQVTYLKLTAPCSQIKNDCRPHHLNGNDGLLSHTPKTANEQTAEHDEVRSCWYELSLASAPLSSAQSPQTLPSRSVANADLVHPQYEDKSY